VSTSRCSVAAPEHGAERLAELVVMDLSEYELEPLNQDGERILYRGVHASPADVVPRVLVVAPAGEYALPATLARVEHEYSIAAELDPRWAVRPLGLARYRGQPVLVLEDPGGEPLDRLLGTPMEIGLFLRVAVGVCAAVTQLHSRGLVHKDIRPANIMMDPSTGRAWLMGFGIASRLPRERQSPDPPEVITGTLAYMAPEQTGRMNRSIDSRSDLYSLGVTLYEALTGSLPFSAADPMEWVHCHIARQPLSPAERSKDVPALVSTIVTKLLAKTAEDRYQTAAGLEHDFRRCLAEWVAERRIPDFPLGEYDRPDRLVIPEKLYGRARELETLFAAFDRVVTSGRPELVLVSGYSGVGKSSVVNELHKVLVPPRGLFASGKFDQYKRDTPYATLAQAFQSLIRRILTRRDSELAEWRDALGDALGPNARLMIDLVPELTLILGEQPPVPELSLHDAQRRFQLVFRRFVGVFARSEHPLALFLDDLQWLDSATLGLLEDLMSQADVQHLLVIGAYRDNEVGAAHPLTRTLEAIRKAGALVDEINLSSLTQADVAQLVADSLHCELAATVPLALLVYEKTAGNPFFTIQFISALAGEGLLIFDHVHPGWSWDLGRIRAKRYTDNVADLLVSKLTRLPVETQQALQWLACLGNSAEVTTLSLAHGTSEDQVHADLVEAVRLELIERLDGAYKFVHDRVREAAYSLIPETLRAEVHLRIGRLLAAHIPADKREEAIFEIVNQLNRGSHRITSAEERERVAELNLIAGRRAKASAAYASALTYLVAGAGLLPEDGGERRHELAFALELQRAECEYVTGQLGPAEARLSALATRAVTLVERAAVAGLRVDLYVALDQSERAIAVGLDYLRYLGVEWSAHPTAKEARGEYERVWSQPAIRALEDLRELPILTDPTSLATLDILTKLAGPAYVTDNNLHVLVSCRAVNLSLERGHCDASCGAYLWLALSAGARFGDYEAGYRFGRLGFELVQQRGWKRLQPRTYMLFGAGVIPWTRPVKIARDLLRRAFEVGHNIGDVIHAVASRGHLNTNMLVAGDHLVEVESEAERGLESAQNARFGLLIDMITAQLGLVRTLRGFTHRFGSFDDERFDELRAERRFASNPNLQFAECLYWIRKLQARFLAGDGAAALDASRKAERLLWTLGSLLEEAEYHFYSALSRAVCCDSAPADARQPHLAALTVHQRQLDIWAQNCPENFENRAALVGAEIARIEGRELDAERLYEQAIRSARANGFVHNEALAHELAARFYAARGFEQFAQLYLQHARSCYLRWGADGKVRQLEELHPHLKKDEPAPGPTGTITAPVEHLDLATVLKVSQAVSGELVLEKLVETVLRTAIEHAGAERGLLVLPRGGELSIHAEANTKGSSVMFHLREAPLSAAELPESVVRYAARTQESVVLDDASARHPFSADEYIREQRARSVLCLPLVKHGALVALLYLENNLAPNVFTPARIAVLKLLASEVAMSLDNSRLYRELREREARIRRLVDANIIGVIIADLDGAIIEANDAFLEMLGYSRDDLVAGRLRWTALTPAEWHAATQRAIAQIRATGRCDTYEKEYIRKDGSRVPALVGGAAFEDTRSHSISFVLDLSERKHAEEGLQRAHAELAHVTRVMTLGELTASIAHEVTQPLAAIVTNGDACLRLLASDGPNLGETREAVASIIRDARRAAEVVARVRALLKKSDVDRTPLDLGQVIRDVLALVQPEMARHRIVLRTSLSDDLPTVFGDRIQLQQVLLNLLTNAIEAMCDVAEGRRELVISARRHDAGPDAGVLVAMEDAGVGFEGVSVDRLFEPLYTTKPDGLGMGLSISRSIIVSHGGRLWATANAGCGATFQFVLPAWKSQRP
jgi:PAS domain S-box-containing protein